jgi:hypothetical protein
MRVYISTVNGAWATMSFLFVARCARQDADGVVVLHRAPLFCATGGAAADARSHAPQRLASLACPPAGRSRRASSPCRA